jgi:hypothetical protein
MKILTKKYILVYSASLFTGIAVKRSVTPADTNRSSVGIATRYVDGPGIESRWGRDFSQPSRPALGPTQPPIQCVPSLFPGVKRPGRGVDHPPSSSARVKERVELYLYSPSGPSWPVLGKTLTLPFCLNTYIYVETRTLANTCT